MFAISFSLSLISGYLIPAILSPETTNGERLALAFPFGLGLATLMIWLTLALNLPLTAGSFTLAQLIITAFLLFIHRGENPFLFDDIQFSKNIHHASFTLILILFLLGLLFNSVFPVFISDGIGYKMHGAVAIKENNLFIYRDYFRVLKDQNRTLGFHLISGYTSLFDFNFPKLSQSLTYISLVGLFHSGVRRITSGNKAWAFTLLISTAPMVWWQSILYLNNLLAGFYFFCGVLYWYFATDRNEPRSFLISSIGFALASWVRFEFIVFYGLFLASTFLWSLEKRRFIGAVFLASFPLGFSGIWAVYSVVFYPEDIQTNYSIMIFLFYLFSCFIYIFLYYKHYEYKKIIRWSFLILILSLFVTLTSGFIDEKVNFIFKVFFSKLTWNVLNQSVWGFSIILIFILPFCDWKTFPVKNRLFLNLLILFFGISFLLAVVMKDSTLLNRSVIDKIKYFLETPGKIAIRTSAREHLAMFPGLLFLIALYLGRESSNAGMLRKIQNVLYRNSWANGLNALIFGNLITLSILFIFPRLDYLKTNFDKNDREMLITRGSRDNINLYQSTYQIAQAVAKITPENSAIIFPNPFGALKERKKPYDSIGVFAIYDALYPRIIYWKGFGKKVRQEIPKGIPLYRIVSEQVDENQCEADKKPHFLGYYQWRICIAGVKIRRRLTLESLNHNVSRN